MEHAAVIYVPSFASTQIHLLTHELNVSLEESRSYLSQSTPKILQRAGMALTNLVSVAQRTGLGGKTVIELAPDAATGDEDGLAPHSLRTGDIVALAEQPAAVAARKAIGRDPAKAGVRGVVVKVTRTRVSVVLEDKEPLTPAERQANEGLFAGQQRVWLVKLADEVTHKRMKETMERLGRMVEREYSQLIKVTFALNMLSPTDEVLVTDWFDATLNQSQKEAVQFGLGRPDVALIHGPPGTGKTHTLIELILQLLRRQLRVLVCGPSNISVDNIMERLAPHKIAMVRLGHPARLLPSVLNHSLDVLAQSSDAAAIVRDVRQEMETKQKALSKVKSGKERRQLYAELKDLRKEYRTRERTVVERLLGNCRVVLTTLHGAGGYQLRAEKFDVVVIDEASQALEAQCWVALLSAKKVILTGDHLQLPPTIKSRNTKVKSMSKSSTDIMPELTLETTLFTRLLELHGPGIKRMLTTQYRMNEKIMRFPSDTLYESKLIAAEAVKGILLRDLPYDVRENEDTIEPLIFFDTQGDDFPEKNEETSAYPKEAKLVVGESRSNEMEAALVKFHIENLTSHTNSGVKAEDIAVITPYNAQLTLLSHTLKDKFPGLELGSVDGFQGREKEAVVVSLVRSNAEREVGFLGEKRRLNVAMTRARRSLTVVGDSETLRSNEFLRRWMDFLEEHADLRYPCVSQLLAA